MKAKKLLWLIAPVMAFSALAAGCSWDKVSVTSIEKTASYATEDVYTVTYSDGTSTTFTVQHGRNVTVQDLFDRYKEEYGDSLTYDEFLQKYLVTYERSEYAVSEALLSSFQVYAARNLSAQQGSAILYAVNKDKDDAYLLTNYHVAYVASSRGGGIASEITCSMFGSDTTSFQCTYIGGAASSDLAVLRASLTEIQRVNPDVKPVTLAEDYCVGETIYAIGNAEGEGISATTGVVSVESEVVKLDVDGTSRYHRVMRIDAAIYHGNSGGGLFNTRGELIGITNSGDETDQNINYAIPLSVVKGTADNILHYYSDGDSKTSGAYKVTLGITVTPQNARYVYDSITGKGYITEELVISEISSSFLSISIAAAIGLKVGDTLTALFINGKEYLPNRSYEISDLLLNVRAGDEIKFAYTRSGASATTSAYTIKAKDLSSVD